MAAINQEAVGRAGLDWLCEHLNVSMDTLRGELFQTCVSCWHFDEQREICKLCNMHPPARVIVNGCPQYYDEIPF